MFFNYKSQHGQDKEILEILNYKKNGFFLDIGCSEPEYLSNTYVLEKDFIWSGICVDPRKGLRQSFSNERTAIFEESAIFTHSGKIAFSDLGVYAGVNDANITDTLTTDQNFIYEVNCLTVEELFRKHNAPTTIDYMSLDVEGAELLILETFPFDRYKVLTASVEHNSYLGSRQRKKGEEILELMEKHNFKLHKTLKCDFIFVYKS